MKETLKKIWEKIKAWATLTAWPWLKKSWMQIVNIIILFVAYGKMDDAQLVGTGVVGFWIFLLLAYYIFWKLFGFDKVWKKFVEERKKKKTQV